MKSTDREKDHDALRGNATSGSTSVEALNVPGLVLWRLHKKKNTGTTWFSGWSVSRAPSTRASPHPVFPLYTGKTREKWNDALVYTNSHSGVRGRGAQSDISKKAWTNSFNKRSYSFPPRRSCPCSSIFVCVWNVNNTRLTLGLHCHLSTYGIIGIRVFLVLGLNFSCIETSRSNDRIILSTSRSAHWPRATLELRCKTNTGELQAFRSTLINSWSRPDAFMWSVYCQSHYPV